MLHASRRLTKGEGCAAAARRSSYCSLPGSRYAGTISPSRWRGRNKSRKNWLHRSTSSFLRFSHCEGRETTHASEPAAENPK